MLSPEDWAFWSVTLAAQVAVFLLLIAQGKYHPVWVVVLVGGPLWVFAARAQCALQPLPEPADQYCWGWALLFGGAAAGAHFVLVACTAHCFVAPFKPLLLAPVLYLAGVRPLEVWAPWAAGVTVLLAVPACCHKKAQALADLVDGLVLAVAFGALLSAGLEAVLPPQREWHQVLHDSASWSQLFVWVGASVLSTPYYLYRFYRAWRYGYTEVHKDDVGRDTGQLTSV